MRTAKITYYSSGECKHGNGYLNAAPKVPHLLCRLFALLDPLLTTVGHATNTVASNNKPAYHFSG